MKYEAYFNDGSMTIVDDYEKANRAGAYRIVPILPHPKKKVFKINVVSESGKVLESVSAIGTRLDVTPESLGMKLLFE